MCPCVCARMRARVCVCVYISGAQKREFDPLELEFQVVVRCPMMLVLRAAMLLAKSHFSSLHVLVHARKVKSANQVHQDLQKCGGFLQTMKTQWTMNTSEFSD